MKAKDQRLKIRSIILPNLLLLIVFLAYYSCKGTGTGSEPESSIIPTVVGADVVDEEPTQPGIQTSFLYNGSSFIIELILDDNIVTSETILFKSSTLPSYLDLDQAAGEITVTPDWNSYADTVYFWSEGASSGEETSANSLRIDFSTYSD